MEAPRATTGPRGAGEEGGAPTKFFSIFTVQPEEYLKSPTTTRTLAENRGAHHHHHTMFPSHDLCTRLNGISFKRGIWGRHSALFEPEYKFSGGGGSGGSGSGGSGSGGGADSNPNITGNVFRAGGLAVAPAMETSAADSAAQLWAAWTRGKLKQASKKPEATTPWRGASPRSIADLDVASKAPSKPLVIIDLSRPFAASENTVEGEEGGGAKKAPSSVMINDAAKENVPPLLKWPNTDGPHPDGSDYGSCCCGDDEEALIIAKFHVDNDAGGGGGGDAEKGATVA